MRYRLAVQIAAALAAVSAALGAADAVRPLGMFALYQENRERGIPNYITEDFVLLSHSMLTENAITTAEEKTLYPSLCKLTAVLKKKLATAPQKDEAVAANRNFVAVLEALLKGSQDLAGAPNPETAATELSKVRAAEGTGRSPLMLQNVDYTQFRVRGKYTKTEALGRYFLAYRYASAALFPLLESESTGVSAADADRLTRQALLFSRLLADPDIAPTYAMITSRFDFLFGPSEDMTAADYGRIPAPATGTVAQMRQKLFQAAKHPTILSGLVDTSRLEPGRKPADVLTGWRLLPQGALPDAAAMQELVFEHVTDYRGNAKPVSLAEINGKRVKGFPLGLEVMALLGSPVAAARLRDGDDQNYAGYADAWKKAQSAIKRPAGLASDQLGVLRGLLTPEAPDHSLNAALAFWTLQRHASVLYAKQSYTAVSKGIPVVRPRDKSWLEPAPELYARLQKLVTKMEARFTDPKMAQFSQVLARCVAISTQERKGTTPAAADAKFLNDLDETLAGMIGSKDAPVVVDVHTEPNTGQVLEEGIGFAAEASKALAGDTAARGARFRHYEFKHEMQDRLTDEKFLAMLQEGKL